VRQQIGFDDDAVSRLDPSAEGIPIRGTEVMAIISEQAERLADAAVDRIGLSPDGASAVLRIGFVRIEWGPLRIIPIHFADGDW